MMPIFQLGKGHGFHLFESGVNNMGEFVQNDVKFGLTITKDGAIVFQDEESRPDLDLYFADTLKIDGTYEPIDFGNYAIEYKLTQAEEDDFPEDNVKTIFFQVTDSVYSRAGDQPDYSFSYNNSRYERDDWDLNANLGHFMGSVFPIYENCEVEGISVYIMGGLADGLIDFRYTIWKNDYFTGEFTTPYLILATESVDLDSSMFNQWIYLPINKDGETEFLEPGYLYYTGVEYNNWHEDEMIRKHQGLSIGATSRSPVNDIRAMFFWPKAVGGSSFGMQGSNRNLMVHLIIDDHSTSVQGEPFASSFSLDQNYPNPFSNETEIAYTLDKGANVSFEITDVTGRSVMKIEEGLKPSGKHSVSFKRADLNPGIYFYTLKAGLLQETKTMIISN